MGVGFCESILRSFNYMFLSIKTFKIKTITTSKNYASITDMNQLMKQRRK